jgi:ATP-dependent Lhr-like helicase
LISQTSDGQIILGAKGEKLVGHFSFFTAFQTPEEYRLEYNGKTIGTLPIDFPLAEHQLIIFAGKRWKILNINEKNKVIILKKNTQGKAPKFGGSGLMIDDMVIQEIFNVYMSKQIPVYLDATAKNLFGEGIEYFYSLGLDKKQIIHYENSIILFTWLGDKTTLTINNLLLKEELIANYFGGPIIEVNCSIEELKIAIQSILNKEMLSNTQLANNYKETQIGKHDLLLTKELCDLDFGEQYFNVKGARDWLLTCYDNMT